MLLLALHTAAEGGIVREAGHSRAVGVDMGPGDTAGVAACVGGDILEQEEHHIDPDEGTALEAGVGRSPDAVAEDIVLGEVHIGLVEGHARTQVGESLLRNIQYYTKCTS